MAPVIWGLDLAEIRWSKFKSGYMWNTDYHLRRSKFIIYQLAMIFCVVSESLGTAALSDYIKQQNIIEKAHPGSSTEYNDDFIGIASYNIFAGIYVAFVFGGAFFFDLFWPERREDHGVRIAWRCCSVAASVIVLADVIAFTVILVSRTAYTIGLSSGEETTLVGQVGGSPLDYAKNGRAVASVVFLWLGFPFVVASTVIMWFSLSHDEHEGPWSTHKQQHRISSESVLPDGTMQDVELGNPPAPGVHRVERPDGANY